MSNSAEKSIFLNALDYESDKAQDDYLQSACGDDVQLRANVDALLNAHCRTANPLDSPVAAGQVKVAGMKLAVSDATVDEPAGSKADDVGKTFGSYRLMEKIGEGGFGLVYVANQEQPVRRKVALKIIKPGTGSSEVLARFDAERQAVALMDHPNIAQVFDAGVTDDARPYFVMELVRGVPITEFCVKRGLNLIERLKLFEDVCAATQHAHQKGVIHRDLKPSNVLVTLHDTKAVAKVIDFGVAKAMGQSLTDQTIYTRLYSMVGTPLYMSPEQASMSGLDVDTRSDIYSLGVMLYEILTGTTPFDRRRLDTVGYDEMRRIIREEEPPKPSTRLTTIDRGESNTVGQTRDFSGFESADASFGTSKRLESIPSDLDWIVMKAMEKNRSRRYESAAAMATDLRRFMNQEPIEARPPSRVYRLSKFARRNQAALLTGLVVATALLVGTAVSLYQASQAIDERNQKDVALQDAIVAKNQATQARLEVEQFTDRLKTANALIGEARAFEDDEDFEAAEFSYGEAVKLVPNYYLVWVHRARLRIRLKRWDDAADDFSHAIRLDAPGNSGDWQGVLALFEMTGRREDADRLCQLLLKPTRESADAWDWNVIRSCLVCKNLPADISPQMLAERSEELLAESPPGGPRKFDGPPFGFGGDDRRGPPPEFGPDDEFDRPPRSGRGFGRGRNSGPDGRGPEGPQPPDGPGMQRRGGPNGFGGPDRGGRNEFLPRNVQNYVAGWANLNAKNYDRAIELFEAVSGERPWHAQYVTLALKAMAEHGNEHPELAEALLQKSNEALDEVTSTSGQESQKPSFWVDFVESVVTNRDANRLIKGISIR